ncbi:MAG: hypothetical protein LE168_05800 [Endomicrobium sp.]|nr:hypothetical protein [Endomicrobium sp.]
MMAHDICAKNASLRLVDRVIVKLKNGVRKANFNNCSFSFIFGGASNVIVAGLAGTNLWRASSCNVKSNARIDIQKRGMDCALVVMDDAEMS